jgi:hypothetical protein
MATRVDQNAKVQHHGGLDRAELPAASSISGSLLGRIRAGREKIAARYLTTIVGWSCEQSLEPADDLGRMCAVKQKNCR